MARPNRRFLMLALSFLAVGGLLGGLFGGDAQADSQRADELLWTFGRVLALVEDHYVGEADSEQLVENAISGMLQTLDPHSNYLNPESFSEMRDEQRGRFHGLGIQITKRGPEKPLTIIAPIDDTPAARAGLQSGDIIAKIEGQPTIDLTVHEAVRLLKGDKGTRVSITVERPGTDDPFDVVIERDEIPIESIRLVYMLQPGVGFVRISNFTSTTATELDEAIEQLTSQGMDRLILDLRGNPGGLLDQAVQVAERFVPPRKRIVYTRGRIPGSNQDYTAKRGIERLDIPLVVLVDHSSASASEIVSGAVQDHDRGLVVGETTFGKGLVQRVIPLRDHGALAVTTAKYYTPSGRLIQRDYSDLDEYYMGNTIGDERPEDVPEAEADDAPTDDSASSREVEREVFFTASGRKVYGGGGVQPDYIVKATRPEQMVLSLLRQNTIFDYAVLYSNSHPDLVPGFELGAEQLAAFRKYVDEREIEYEPEDFVENAELIALRLRAQIARVKWNQVEESRVLAEADPQIQQALQVFEEAARLARLNPAESALERNAM